MSATTSTSDTTSPKHRPDGATPEPETDGYNVILGEMRDSYVQLARATSKAEFARAMILATAYLAAEARTNVQTEFRSNVATFDDMFRANLRSIVGNFGALTNESDTSLVNRASDAARIRHDFTMWLPALEAGDVTMRQATVMLRNSSNVPEHKLEEYGTRVLDAARTSTIGQTETFAKKLAAQLAIAEFEDACEREYAARKVTIQDLDYGMSEIRAYMPTTAAKAAFDLLTREAKVLRDDNIEAARENKRRVREAQARGEGPRDGDTTRAGATGADATGADAAGTGAAGSDATGSDAASGNFTEESSAFIEDPRTIDQLRADLFLETILTATPQSILESDTGGAMRVKANISIVVPVMSLVDPKKSRDVTNLEGETPISFEDARRFMGDITTFDRILTDPINGHTLTVDTRNASADMRRYLRVRDGACRFPGCRRPATQCELDHTVPWACDGKTDVENLAFLCPRHHTQKHQKPWRVRHLGGGILEWTSPLGDVIVTKPKPLGPVFAPVDDPAPF